MNDKQFDPLDDRFRQAAEQFDPPYDPEDWTAMEKLLDGKKRKRRIFPFWWITDALMVGMVFLFIYQVNKNWNNTAKTAVLTNSTGAIKPVPAGVNQKEKETNDTQVFNPGENNGTETYLQETKPVLSPGIVKKSPENYVFSPDPGPGRANTKTRAPFSPEPGTITGNPSSQIQGNSGKTVLPLHQTSLSGQEINTQGTAIIVSENSKNADSSGMEQPVIQGVITTEFSEPKAIPDTARVQTNQTEVAEKAEDLISGPKEKTGENSKSKKGQFFISATFGMEKSGVKESSLGPAGNVYGGFAGYQWHKDWSVKLGVLFTDKNYSGGSGIYKLPASSYYSEITKFKAICNIIEIPLLVSYQFKHGKKSNWLISAGPVTSIMQKEEYHYNYINNSGGTGYGKKYYSTNEVEWFSGFRISPAYERFFGNRFSLSGEPFIQLPLSGVGQGSVKLYSLGFQLTTSIHLGSKKQH